MMMNYCSETSDALYHKGLDSAYKNNLTEAIEFLERALSLTPEHEAALKLLGLCYYQYGFMNKAKLYLAKSKDSADYDISAEVVLYEKTIKAIKSCKSLSDYRKAVKMIVKENNDRVIDRNIIGCLYMIGGDKLRAMDYFTGALKLDNHNPAACRFLQDAGCKISLKNFLLHLFNGG